MKEYYKVKEIADLLEVSKTAIQNAIKAAGIDYDKKEANKHYYGLDKTKQIIASIRPDFDFSIFANSPTETANSQSENAEKTANSPTKTANSQSESDNSTNQQIVDELKRTISIFETELKEKNEQLKVKDKQIEALNNTIQMLNDTIQGQLLLNAQEKKLIEAETGDDNQEKDKKPEKKSFFRRFFGKNIWFFYDFIL